MRATFPKTISLLFCLTTLLTHPLTANQPFLSAPEIASGLDMKWKWATPQKEALLKKEGSLLRLEADNRCVTFNNHPVWLGHRVRNKNGLLCVHKQDLTQTLAPLINPKNLQKTQKLYHIILDPGHGGKDQGTVNKILGVAEKDATLDLAVRLKRILNEYGYKVTLTRVSDRFLSLPDRTQFANQEKADLFISLHFNAVSNGANQAKGIETYVFTPQNQPSTSREKLHSSDQKTYPANRYDPWNALIGFHTQAALCESLGAKDRGLRRARFSVLQDLECPALLIEGGFLSHPEEGKNIANPQYRERIAQAISKGVLNYQNILNQLRTS